MNSERDTNQTTVQDIECWFEIIYAIKGLSFSGHKLKKFGGKIWGITILEHLENKDIHAFIIIDDADPELIKLEIRSVLGEVPQSNSLPFYQKCLELNCSIFSGSISLNGAQIWYVQNEYLENITFDKLALMFANQIGTTAELYETLANEFEMKKVGHPEST
ncbi:MAG: hypothetical protein ISR88_09300 [Candidatus Marinimicrobia bacterium]|nr:hypothetical protein [Candidatus Neomarinimicrobiota bacterium]